MELKLPIPENSPTTLHARVSDDAGLTGYRTKSEVVYDRLRELLLSGELKPGEVIDQAQLCETLHVSRMPLRQSLIQLADAGLVYLMPHHSAVAMPLLAGDIDEIYTTRAALETVLIRAAIPKLDAADHAALETLLRQVDEPSVRAVPREFAKLDRRFHERLYRVAGYQRTFSYFENLRDLSDRFVAVYYADHGGQYAEDADFTANCHEEILRLCMAGEADAAIAAMLTDLWRTAEHLMRIAELSPDIQTPQSNPGLTS